MIFRFIYAFMAVVFIVAIARAEAIDSLDEVNAARRARGLPPFVKCPQLTAGALNVAQFRADRLIQGHTRNDFSGLPVGVTATASGCAAWFPSWGWGACCTYENHRYAGAAWSMGRDGKRYTHLFVR